MATDPEWKAQMRSRPLDHTSTQLRDTLKVSDLAYLTLKVSDLAYLMLKVSDLAYLMVLFVVNLITGHDGSIRHYSASFFFFFFVFCC